MMAKVDQFLNDLVYYDKENIHPDVVKVTSIGLVLYESEFFVYSSVVNNFVLGCSTIHQKPGIQC
jgi:hypothetical protein